MVEFICNEICNTIASASNGNGSNSGSGSSNGAIPQLLDSRDGDGNTPLHLAARRGSLVCCATLLRHGARAEARNDLGLRPADCAALAGSPSRRPRRGGGGGGGGDRSNACRGCAEFLLLFETSMGLAGRTAETSAKQEGLQQENEELKGYFK